VLTLLPENLILFLRFYIFLQGFISCYNRDDILKGLERIEDDIAKGRFEWRENKDVRSNIVDTLIDRVGEPARKLDATISQYVQKLTILRLWLHSSADTIITQIEQLQVNLCSYSCKLVSLFL
jgi:argininosuccinate lyase